MRGAPPPIPSETATLRIAPPDFLAAPGLRSVLAALPRARLVGGCVRDALAHRPVADIDLATPDEPDAIVAALEHAGLRAIPTGFAHGTITALAGDHPYEITTLRRDIRTDGRHATVAFTDDWRQDAARRDFTINAMSMTPDGAVFDYFGGVEDLRAGRVRFVGDPATRIAEDYLRILRYFRFFARYGHAGSDKAGLAAIRAAVPGLSILSAERVWSELKRILAAPAPDAALTLMQDSGVLAAILPGVALSQVNDLPPEPMLRLAALDPPDPAALADSLKLSGAEAEALLALLGPTPPPDATDATLRTLLADTPADILIGRARIARLPDTLIARLAALPAPRFPLQGRDLLALGHLPGPALGATLARLRARWLASGCALSREDLLAELAARPAP